MKKLHVVLFVFLFLTFPITGFSATITVSAKAEIQSAGHSSPGWAGELPPVYSFSPGPNKNLNFSSISGSISWDSQNYFNAEGSSWYGTDWGPNRGVYGIFHTNRCFFLIGVFLDDAKPSGPVPGRL